MIRNYRGRPFRVARHNNQRVPRKKERELPLSPGRGGPSIFPGDRVLAARNAMVR